MFHSLAVAVRPTCMSPYLENKTIFWIFNCIRHDASALYVQNLKSVALPVPELGVAKKFGAVPGYMPTLYSPPPKKKYGNMVPSERALIGEFL